MTDRTAVDQFAELLRAHRARCGNPTHQKLAREMNVSRTMVTDWLNGHRFPTWAQAKSLVLVCDPDLVDCADDLREWQRHWEQAHAERDAARYAGRYSDVLVRDDTSTSTIAPTWYRDNPEFYSAAARRVRTATREIRCTYLRAHPPTRIASPASAEYFEAILEWARNCGTGQRSARRVIAAPSRNGIETPHMLEWLRTHHEQTADILSYEAGVIEWSPAVDGVSMALLDDTEAFLAFSGGARQKVNGFSVADRDFVSYYAVHFEQLWSASTPLADYLAQSPS